MFYIVFTFLLRTVAFVNCYSDSASCMRIWDKPFQPYTVVRVRAHTHTHACMHWLWDSETRMPCPCWLWQ